ncbi:MAG: major facilitator superfamily domain-containing protein [Monoraphidium minutum]|nr:MAG: major facilitator superfamily domain-containing protein [Monoraphidium minutum]
MWASAGAGSPIKERRWACADVADAACAGVLASADPAVGFCGLQRSQWAWTEPKQSLVSQFDLVCGDEWKAQTANSFFFLGYLIGSGIFGQLADIVGRKRSTLAAVAISAVFSAAGAACTSYWSWLAMRLVSGVGAAGAALGAYILATEPIGPGWRGAAGISSQIFFIVGEFTLVGVAAIWGSWRAQAGACAALHAALLLLFPLIPESGRWLLVQGRKEEAMQVLETFARRNGTRAPDQPLVDIGRGPAGAGGAPAPRLTLGEALRDWHILRRFLVLSYSWMVICMTYYGISFALGSLGGSLKVSFMVSAIAELPSYLFTAWAIDHWGRHNTMAACTLLGGLACTACAFVRAGGAQMLLASVGKFGVAGAFAIASIYTSELFPTLIRSGVLGAANQAARVGGIVAPFIALAGTTHNSSLIPFLTYGLAALLSGLLIFTLPETLGVPLPDTMQDMDNIASIFTHKTLKTKGLKAAAASMFKPRVALGAPKPRGAAAKKRAAAGGPGQSVWAEDEAGAAPEGEDEARGLIPAHRPQGPPPGAGGGGDAGGGAGAGAASAGAGL